MAKKRKAATGKRPAPTRKTNAPPTGYANKRKTEAMRQRFKAQLDRDIGPALALARENINWTRRKKSSKSPKAFAETYLVGKFGKGLTPDQLEIFKAMKKTIESSALLCTAQPRSSGKTQQAIAVILWACLHAIIDYAALVAANDGKAKNLLKAIKMTLTTNQAIIQDFPEVCLPALALGGVANRAPGQLCDEQPTLIVWGKSQVVFPWIEGSDSKGCVIEASGILGSNIRGSFYDRPDGRAARPQFVLVDDPQTPRSAKSRDQCDERERIINSDIGLAGEPGKRFSVFVMCTVIRRNDLADRLLNRERNYLWHGIRRPFMKSFPTATAKWEAYNQLRIEDLRAGLRDTPNATKYYRIDRKAMDAGAETAAPWRFLRERGEISSVQHAMNYYFSDPYGFACEFQQEPPIEGGVERPQLTADMLYQRLNMIARARVPLNATKVTAFIDVQHRLLYWVVAAWDEAFTGAVLDYGSYPDQGSEYFTLQGAQNLLDPAGERDLVGIVFEALNALVAQLCTRNWLREDDVAIPLERILIDCKDHQVADAVFAVARNSVYANRVLPTQGFASKVKDGRTMMDWKAKPGELKGNNWVLQRSAKYAARQLLIESNHWRSALARGLKRPLGSQGAISFYGNNARRHRMLIDHCTSEMCDVVKHEATGRIFELWSLRPGRPDNHLWDCLVGSMAAAALSGSSHLPAAPKASPAATVSATPGARYIPI